MKAEFSLGVVGFDEATMAIVERLGRGRPFSGGPLGLTRWAVNDADLNDSSFADLAAKQDVDIESDWRRVTEDAAVDAVYVGGSQAGRLAPVISALAKGKVVLCPVPVAMTATDLDLVEEARAKHGGTLLAPSLLGATPAGQEGLRQILHADSGNILSVYFAARRTTSSSGIDALNEFGWEALYFLECSVGSPLDRSHVETRQLFGREGQPDTVVAILRHRNGVVSTLELSRCLPKAYGRNTTEYEIEVITDVGVIRIEPNQHLVHVVPAQPDVARWVDWHPHPVIHVLDELVCVLSGHGRPQDMSVKLRSMVAAMTQLRMADRANAS